jgi:xylulokinase
MATYEGAIVSLLDALDTIDVCSSGVNPDAPLVLIGGGARGKTWQRVVGRLSGRAVSIPEATELVAIGAAIQAAAVITGEEPGVVAARWQTGKGILLEPTQRDDATIARHREVRRLAVAAIRPT